MRKKGEENHPAFEPGTFGKGCPIIRRAEFLEEVRYSLFKLAFFLCNWHTKQKKKIVQIVGSQIQGPNSTVLHTEKLAFSVFTIAELIIGLEIRL